MVGRLMKHELYALFRVLVFLYAAVILFAVLLRISIPAGEVYSNEQASVVLIFSLFYVYAIFAAILAATIMGISRFFKTIFTREGYLTLSFPVTPSQLIWAKLLSALIASYTSVIVCVLSAFIFFAGWNEDLYLEIGNAISQLLSGFGAYLSSDPLLILESVLTCIALIPMSMLYFYLIASVGQLFTKNRKGMTALLVIGSSFVLSLLNALVYQPLLSACSYYVSLHLANWINIVLMFAIDVGCFLLVRYILLHKVNLIL